MKLAVHRTDRKSAPPGAGASRPLARQFARVQSLQRAAGNRAVSAMIQRQLLTAAEIEPNVSWIKANFRGVLNALTECHKKKPGERKQELKALLDACNKWLTSAARERGLTQDKAKRGYVDRLMAEASAEIEGRSKDAAELQRDPALLAADLYVEAPEAYLDDGGTRGRKVPDGVLGYIVSETDKDYKLIDELPDSKDARHDAKPSYYWAPKAASKAPRFEPGPKVFADKDTMPKAEEVMQTDLGDCYLQAALASVAATNPRYIRDMITEDEKTGTVLVRLFRRVSTPESDDVAELKPTYKDGQQTGSEKAPPAFKPEYVRVNRSRPVDREGQALYNKGALWVSLVQKAWTAGGFGGGDAGSYAGTIGGRTGHALQVLLGSRYVRAAAPTAYEGKKGFTEIKNALTAGRLVLAASKTWEDKGEGSGSSGESLHAGLASTHAYTVLAARGKKPSEYALLLRNPWGKVGRGYEGGKKTRIDEGTFWLSIADFNAEFDQITIL